jgi:hypothetical protein
MGNGIIERMQAEIAELKAKVAAMEEWRSNGKTPKTLSEARKYNAQADRDEIIEKAKRDVAKLVDRGNDISQIGEDGNETFNFFRYVVDFVINREKRTVVALVKRDKRQHKPNHRGIAKCVPDDCFNVHIGKAIALRRALGLEVPAEYLNAPQPTEVRVGDIVKYRNAQRLKTVVTDETPTPLSRDNTRISHARLSVKQFGARIIDDSREEVAE